MVYDPRLSNQWAADIFHKGVIKSVVAIIEERMSQGFSGKSIDPHHIRQCVLQNVLETAYPAGVA